MFVRFLPRLLERGAAVRYVCRQPLYSLYGAQPALTRIEVLPQGAPRGTHEGCACYATLLSLPHLLGINDPGTAPYLTPVSQLADEWAARIIGDSRPRIGVVWSANPNTPIGPEKSMPLEALRGLLEMQQFSFFSLQLGGSEMLKALPAVADLAPQIGDFADTAAILANLDLLVTVDTAAAHLAGALGKRALVMAPADSDWRWGGSSPQQPYWYGSARVFRQARPGEWGPVVEAVMAELKKERRP
jgi:ADP-heptose:LPS heptosyltransferase